MLLSSLQTAIEVPGLPFGLDDVGKGWKRILLQVTVFCLSLIGFFPIFILLLRLQVILSQKFSSLDQLTQSLTSIKYLPNTSWDHVENWNCSKFTVQIPAPKGMFVLSEIKIIGKNDIPERRFEWVTPNFEQSQHVLKNYFLCIFCCHTLG